MINAEKGVLYFATGQQPYKKLIDSDVITNPYVLKVELTEEQEKDILNYLKEEDNIFHLCISVYRDAVIINDDTYNICLSCGDFWKNDKKFYLSTENLEGLKAYLNKLK